MLNAEAYASQATGVGRSNCGCLIPIAAAVVILLATCLSDGCRSDPEVATPAPTFKRPQVWRSAQDLDGPLHGEDPRGSIPFPIYKGK